MSMREGFSHLELTVCIVCNYSRQGDKIGNNLSKKGGQKNV
jgi:hypothetical protein